MKEQKDFILTDAESEKIILMSVAAKPQTEEQVQKVLNWAWGVRAEELMLQCVLSGDVAPFIGENGEIYFKKMRDTNPRRTQHESTAVKNN